MEEQNTRMERKLEEVTQELEAQRRELWEVYKCLDARPQEALIIPVAPPPPTMTAASTQTEVAPSAPSAKPAALTQPPPRVPSRVATPQREDAPVAERPTNHWGRKWVPHRHSRHRRQLHPPPQPHPHSPPQPHLRPRLRCKAPSPRTRSRLRRQPPFWRCRQPLKLVHSDNPRVALAPLLSTRQMSAAPPDSPPLAPPSSPNAHPPWAQ